MPNRYGPGWTDERTERLRALWIAGKSAAEIALLLGGVTRNAVIGKVHRLGLISAARQDAARPSAPRPSKPRPAPKAAQPVKRAPRPPTPAQVAAAEPIEGGVLFFERRRGQCAWPLGRLLAPAGADMPVCGAPVHGESPWCAAHHARAYEPQRPRPLKLDKLLSEAEAQRRPHREFA